MTLNKYDVYLQTLFCFRLSNWNEQHVVTRTTLIKSNDNKNLRLAELRNQSFEECVASMLPRSEE